MVVSSSCLAVGVEKCPKSSRLKSVTLSLWSTMSCANNYATFLLILLEARLERCNLTVFGIRGSLCGMLVSIDNMPVRLHCCL